LQDHPDKDQVQLALAQCGALKKYMDGKNRSSYSSPIGKSEPPSSSLILEKFVGCMPKNFLRRHIEQIQRSPENGYFISEKTDGVRHLLIFTGKTAVLLDRKNHGKQPKPRDGSDNKDPFAPILDLIQPGTVLDGEVVMHRKLRRPIFIVFDVLTISTTQPVLQLPFEQRLRHLKQASFRTAKADRDMFDPKAVSDPKASLPLVRKNFVTRQDLDELLDKRIVEERGMRTYRFGDVHYHLTDGIIFQPNLPYVCSTDENLLKWKYLDTVTIDVEILPNAYSRDDDDALRLGVLGEENTRIDMSKYIHLPASERRRLEADRAETGSRIAEVGFDPTTGEWYYLTMRTDKGGNPNHISTVLGTLLELAESLTTEELRYRMSVPPGQRDTYRKDTRKMQKQLLAYQREHNKELRKHHQQVR
jgi:mRNA guanylyltransferase